MPYRADFHCHSSASPDGSLREADIKRMLNLGLDCIAITDHDRIDEALRLQSVLGEAIIVGEEITTTEGEIIGLYLQERVEPGLSAAETVERIKKQHGLVYIPHPFEKVRKGLTKVTIDSIATEVDIIETINGRSFSARARAQAVTWAQVHKVATAASSDAHGRHGWGRVYTELTAKPTQKTLVELIKQSRLHGSSNGYLAYGYPKLNRLRKLRQP